MTRNSERGRPGRTQRTPGSRPADFVGATSGGARAAAELVDRSNRYADTPMDFADATSVLLADVPEVLDVLTLGRRGFTTYRTIAGHGFGLVLNAD